MEDSMVVPQKTKDIITIESNILNLGIYSYRIEIRVSELFAFP